MKRIEEFMRSGVLETYVLGLTTEEENSEVEKMQLLYTEIKDEIDSITNALIDYAKLDAGELNPTIKPFLLASIDYQERLMKGEKVTNPSLLSSESKVEDYASWLMRSDMILPANSENIYAKIIGFQPDVTTAIVWIKDATPSEIHTNEFEKFLILEGTCNIIMDSETYQLKSGSYFCIPLHQSHIVKVTSNIPCKLILQRVAA